MRTLVETRLEPERRVEVKRYACDDCDFSSSSQSVVEEHWAKKHACRKEIARGDVVFCLFDTKEAAEAWLGQRCDEESYRVRNVDWQGPGWYTTETWKQRCPSGCCMDSCMHLIPTSEFCSKQIELAREIMWHVAEGRKLCKEDARGRQQ